MRVEFKVPELGENIDSGDVVKLLVKVGDVIKPEQGLMELETGKAVVEVPCNVEGRVAQILVKDGDKVTVRQSVFVIETDPKASLEAPAMPTDAAKPTPEPPSAVPVAPIPASVTSPEIPAAPGARRIARELGIELTNIRGSGPDGFITEEDVRTAAPRMSAASSKTAALPSPLPDFSKYGHIERKPMTSVRLATAEHMIRAWTSVPHITQYDDADVTQLDNVRKPYAERVAAAGGKLTLTAILVKIVASALKQFPQFNASVDMDAREIVYKQYINVGVAIATERGLLVPMLKDANQKNILEIALELSEMTRKAHARELKPADLEGGSFSITNLGMIGGTHFTPIVNWPEVAVLGVSKSKQHAVWNEDHFEPRMLLPLSLSYDHRVIDGADGAKFLRWICEALEQPFFLALEG